VANQLVEVVVVPRILQDPRVAFASQLLLVEIQRVSDDRGAGPGAMVYQAVDVLDKLIRQAYRDLG